jgi:hypothetical protein
MTTPDELKGDGPRRGTDDGGTTERNVGGREADESVPGRRADHEGRRNDGEGRPNDGEETIRNVGG